MIIPAVGITAASERTMISACHRFVGSWGRLRPAGNRVIVVPLSKRNGAPRIKRDQHIPVPAIRGDRTPAERIVLGHDRNGLVRMRRVTAPG